MDIKKSTIYFALKYRLSIDSLLATRSHRSMNRVPSMQKFAATADFTPLSGLCFFGNLINSEIFIEHRFEIYHCMIWPHQPVTLESVYFFNIFSTRIISLARERSSGLIVRQGITYCRCIFGDASSLDLLTARLYLLSIPHRRQC